MNLSQYLEKHAPSLEAERKFAKSAGISHLYLRHILKGRKDKIGFEIVLGLLRASSGRIKLKTLRPDLFSDGEARRLLRKSAA